MSKMYSLARRVGGPGLMAAALAAIVTTGLAVSPASASVPAPLPVGALTGAFAWGANDFGQLGQGNFIQPGQPEEVSGLTNVLQVAQGREFGAALLSDGTVDTWGFDHDGVLGDGQFVSTYRLNPAPVPGLTGVVQLAAGYQHILALKSDGTVWGWGYNFYRQLGDGTQTSRSTPIQVPGLTGIQQISASYYDSLALGSDGSVWAWGNNAFGQLGDGTTTNRPTPVKLPGLSGVSQISAGFEHSLAVKSDGTLWAWGNNAFGQLGVGTTTNHASPVQVPGLTGVTQVAAGQTHSLAIAGSNGSVWAWGDDTNSGLGDGTTTEQKSPINIGLNGISQISAGLNRSAAVSSTGGLYFWGASVFPDGFQATTPTVLLLPNVLDGTTQTVQVSLVGGSALAIGIPAATVPGVVGMTLEQATAVIEAAGLNVGQLTDVTDCNFLGSVKKQSPGAGTQVALGSAVDLTIGQAPAKPLVCP